MSVKEKPKTLGEHVRQARRSTGLSYRNLGEMSGVDYVTIHRIERGIAANWSNAARLARALNLSLDDIASKEFT